MSVIPLVVGQTVATTEADFERFGGRQGKTLLIRNFDTEQLSGQQPNLSYELRVGPEYKDHRDGSKWPVTQDEPITLLPGAAVIIETEESLHMPKGMFGYIVPKVRWLQLGICVDRFSEIENRVSSHPVRIIRRVRRAAYFFSSRPCPAPARHPRLAGYN
jgi:hypothetical protein